MYNNHTPNIVPKFTGSNPFFIFHVVDSDQSGGGTEVIIHKNCSEKEVFLGRDKITLIGKSGERSVCCFPTAFKQCGYLSYNRHQRHHLPGRHSSCTPFVEAVWINMKSGEHGQCLRATQILLTTHRYSSARITSCSLST